MKICFVIQSLAIGGSSQVVYDLIKNLIDHKDLQISLVVFFDQIDQRYDDLKKLPNLSIFFMSKKKGFDIPFLLRLKRRIRIINPDIISSHLTCVFYLNLIVNYKNLRIFHTIHNDPAADLPAIYRAAIRHNVRRRRIVLICCHESLVTASEHLYRVPVHAVNNGIEIPKENEVSPILKRKNDLLMCSRLTNVKRPCVFVEIVKDLVNAGLTNVTAVVAGDGAEKEKAEALAKNLNVEKNIKFLGALSAVTHLFNDSKIFVSTSLREGAPISILEANSFGVPVVATNVQGVPYMVKNGYNGYTYDIYDYKSATEHIIKLLNNPDLLVSQSENAIRISRERTAKIMADNYLKILKAN